MTMLRTNTVTQFLYCQPGKEEVIELPGAINGSRIINDMIVYCISKQVNTA